MPTPVPVPSPRGPSPRAQLYVGAFLRKGGEARGAAAAAAAGQDDLLGARRLGWLRALGGLAVGRSCLAACAAYRPAPASRAPACWCVLAGAAEAPADAGLEGGNGEGGEAAAAIIDDPAEQLHAVGTFAQVGGQAGAAAGRLGHET